MNAKKFLAEYLSNAGLTKEMKVVEMTHGQASVPDMGYIIGQILDFVNDDATLNDKQRAIISNELSGVGSLQAKSHLSLYVVSMAAYINSCK